jgi:hypothetical protein
LAAAKSTGGILDGRGLSGAGGWLWLLVVYDVIFLAISVMTFDSVVED